MLVELGDIASVQFGFYEKASHEGSIKYLQAKHFDELAQFNDEVEEYLTPSEKSETHLLCEGDVLFVGKGGRNFAALYTNSYGPSIASSIFYVIRIEEKQKYLPAFLCLLLNSPRYQKQLQSLGAGSSILSIRKQELEDFKMNFPSLEKQAELVDISTLHRIEVQVYQKLIQKKQLLVQHIINNTLKS